MSPRGEPPADGSEPEAPDPIDLQSPGWLSQLLRRYLLTYDSSRARHAVSAVVEANPDATNAEHSQTLALRRLERVGLRPTRLSLSKAFCESIGADTRPRDELEAIGLLATQWDILQDIAWLHRNLSGPLEDQLEILAIMAMGIQDYELARELHRAHLEEVAGETIDVEPLAARVEAKIAPTGRFARSMSALSIEIGLAFLEARTLAQIASLFYERAAIEEEGIERLHALSLVDKVLLVEVLVACAWADGKIVPEERRLIEQQIAFAKLSDETGARLLDMLVTRPEPPSLEPLDASTRRFVLEQAILLTLVDDEQADEELLLLESVAEQMGGDEHELDAILVEVAAFYERNRMLIRDFGPVSGSLGRLRRLVVERAQDAVRSSMRILVQEIKETGELAKLMGAASMRQLTPEEGDKVRSQLLDICKTVPTLAIFLLPGGGFLLPVLIKLLPFNLLPTAFGDDPPPATQTATPPGTPPEGPLLLPPTRRFKPPKP